MIGHPRLGSRGWFAVLFLACTCIAALYTESMRVLMLYTPGREVPRTLPQMKKMGYEVELVDSRVPLLCLKDNLDLRLSNVGGFSKNSIVRPLRAAWVTMLRRHADVDKYTIFCESDAWPHISASRLRDWIDSVPIEANVVRLMQRSNRDLYKRLISENANYDFSPISFVEMPPVLDSADVWGTQAMWVAPDKREALADLWAVCSLPVDVALGWAQWSKYPLNVYSAECQLFSQDLYGSRNKGTVTPLLVCMWMDNKCTNAKAMVKDLCTMLPEGSQLVLTTNTQERRDKLVAMVEKQEIKVPWSVQVKDVIWTDNTKLSELLPPGELPPLTCVLSQHVTYQLSYLNDISFRYKTLKYEHGSFGMIDADTGDHVYTGTLVVPTSKMAELSYSTIDVLKEKILYYDMSSWTPDYKLKKVRAPRACIKGLETGVTVAIDEVAARRYDDVILQDEGIAYVVGETGTTIDLRWEGDAVDTAYRKSNQKYYRV